MLNYPLRQTAESVCMFVSWALTLFFSLSWHQLPWGPVLHGSTREALEPSLYKLHAYTVNVWVCHNLEHQLLGDEAPYRDCSCLSPCALYLYPCFDGAPTVNSHHLTQTADFEKTRSNPKQTYKHVHVQNPTAYPRQTTFYHNTAIFSWRHFCVTFIFSYSSPGLPHPGGCTLI